MQDNYKIIDFHTHPFATDDNNICSHIKYCNMSADSTFKHLSNLGIKKICGSVIKRFPDNFTFDNVKELNDEALRLRDYYNGFYYPGFHIHPKYVKESIAEVEKMHKMGLNLVGELVHYHQGWNQYTDKNLFEILEVCDHYKMVVNFHATSEVEWQLEQMDEMVFRFKNIKFVGAHPSNGMNLKHHILRLEKAENYHIDLSGGGLSGYGLLKHLITEFGNERIIFGSDYPVCNVGMFVGGVSLDDLITEEDKEHIFYKNAERLLNIKI